MTRPTVEVNSGSFSNRDAAAGYEILRQRAVEVGLLMDGAARVDTDAAIERLLEIEVSIQEPTADECHRYYKAHFNEVASGDLVWARHILFQVTARIHVPALREKAEGTLTDLIRDPGGFEATARKLSNCPSGQYGGNLGQLSRGDCAPEFERALFESVYIGLYRQLVKTRFGFHIVCVDRREAGRVIPFEVAHAEIAARLSRRSLAGALAKYVNELGATK